MNPNRPIKESARTVVTGVLGVREGGLTETVVDGETLDVDVAGSLHREKS